jgi:hypothetical protein
MAEAIESKPNLYMPESIPVKSDFCVFVKAFQARHVCAMGPLAVNPMTLEITLGVSKTLMARPSDECQAKWHCRGLVKVLALLFCNKDFEVWGDLTYQTPGLSASHCMTSQLGRSSVPGGMIITSRL